YGPNGPATFEADGDGTNITNTHIDGNTGVVTTSGDSGGLIGAVAFFPGGNIPTLLTNSSVGSNTMAANAPNGAAEIDGAGVFNNGPLVIDHSTVNGNRGIATGQSAAGAGGGI